MTRKNLIAALCAGLLALGAVACETDPADDPLLDDPAGEPAPPADDPMVEDDLNDLEDDA
jgi:hypothetical protein